MEASADRGNHQPRCPAWRSSTNSSQPRCPELRREIGDARAVFPNLEKLRSLVQAVRSPFSRALGIQAFGRILSFGAWFFVGLIDSGEVERIELV